ncbi:MAG TPA: HAD family hydrolase [Caulobacteraceae bacterium]|jgi:putative hydrolase of the HAD superfamily|nr:HAD family hydrolase [Caulobacteraceae bacterium]
MLLPRAILFDLDDTILSFERRALVIEALAARRPDWFAPLTPKVAAAAVEARFKAFWADQARHKAWRPRLAEARRMLVAEAFDDLNAAGASGLTPAQAQAFADEFHTRRETEAKLFPGALETIDALRAQGVLLALVTNGQSGPQRGKVERFDLTRRFDHIQIEGDHGFGKPEERSYRHAMQALGVEARDTWMVGDNLEWEVAAPQRLGIFAIWHDHLGDGLPPDSPIRPDRIIRSLAELLPS